MSETIRLWEHGAPGAVGNTPEDQPRLTPYLVNRAAPVSAVIVCPGGGYGMRAAHEGEPIAQWLNGLGLSAFVLDYRVAPYRHPVPLQDAKRAVRMVRARAEEWNVDPRRVGLLGFSAGGHLVATAGTLFDFGDESSEDVIERQSSRPDAIILCYPVISFGEDRHHGSMVNLIGEDPDKALRERLSAELQVTAETPPAFVWHTADDEAVPVQNSLSFCEALSRHGVPYDLHVFESGVHGLGLAFDHAEVRSWSSLCAAWLRKRGFC